MSVLKNIKLSTTYNEVHDITQDVKTVCTTYVQEDWSSRYPLYISITCDEYSHITTSVCKGCKVCNTNLICEKTKNLLEPIMNEYPNASKIYTMADNIIHYCSDANQSKLNICMISAIVTFYLFMYSIFWTFTSFILKYIYLLIFHNLISYHLYHLWVSFDPK